MKTSLNELRLIEDYLLSCGEDEETCLFKAKLILQPELQEDVYWQSKTYQMVQDYGRKQLKTEIEKIHQTLFNSNGYKPFRQQIIGLFSK